MLDIRFIREHPNMVKAGLEKKQVQFDVEYLLALDEKRRLKIKEVDDLRAHQNAVSNEIAGLTSAAAKEKKVTEMKELKTKLGDLEFEMKTLEDEFVELIRRIPNLPLDDVPVGKDETANKVLRQWGKIPKFGFNPKDHVALGEALDIIDTERAARVSGTRFGYLTGGAALLEFALVQFVLGVLTSRAKLKAIAETISRGYADSPFIPVVPPVMIRPEIFTKMARLSEADKDERYFLPKDDVYLAGSAEHTLGPMHMDETIEEERLPLRYVGFSTSFRREAGSYGKDTRGILRVHQFDKLEMESFTVPEDSVKEQEFFVAIQEHLVRALKIPYQVVMISTGDMGPPDARQIDIECWLPGENRYRETHTADLMTDYQARRLNTKVRRRDGRTEFVHMNDATAFAIGRTIITILENYQEKDGSVRIPEVLIPYMHGITEIRK